MASGHVNRANRPNTWLHRPMLHTFKKVLANSEPSTHGGKAVHSTHGPTSSSRCDLTQGDLGFLHPSRGIISVGRDRVGALTEHDRIRPCRVVHAQILTCEPATEVEWHPGNALADALGDERRDLGLRAVLRSSDPNKPAILDAAISRVGGVDFDEHRLLQLGQPLVRSSFLAAPFVLDQSAGREDERKLLGDTPLDSCLLY